MDEGDKITFDVKKNFSYIKPLGAGGTGDTHLFKDETTDILFAFKKYVPKNKKYLEEHYERFVDEIKILFRISHPNIVRVYNYFLYPKEKTGYLQMEYIDGVSIDKFKPDFIKDWNDIFSEVISAFEYLEQNNILHRDIRPANILIDRKQNVKIIDFGFGKILSGIPTERNSILLNWPATEMPNEVQLNQEYNHKTEIYFIGILFKHLLKNVDDFRYTHIIEKMTKINPSQRYDSFNEVSGAISSGVLSEIDFSESDKEIYRRFADSLSEHIAYYTGEYKPINQMFFTLSKLAELIRNSALEEYLQDNEELINCFIDDGQYRYYSRKDIKLEVILDFYNLVTRLSPSKQIILFDNIYMRLSTIEIKQNQEFQDYEIFEDEDDDLPF